jgi:hypothetical protein
VRSKTNSIVTCCKGLFLSFGPRMRITPKVFAKTSKRLVPNSTMSHQKQSAQFLRPQSTVGAHQGVSKQNPIPFKHCVAHLCLDHKGSVSSRGLKARLTGPMIASTISDSGAAQRSRLRADMKSPASLTPDSPRMYPNRRNQTASTQQV